MTSLAPALPNFFSVIIWPITVLASAASSTTMLPLPAARPSALTTKGKPKGLRSTKATASSRVWQIS